MIGLIGDLSLFASRVVLDFFQPPFEGGQILRQLAETGYRSLPLVIASGFALGTVMTLHTRNSLVMFGASSMIPAVQAMAFSLRSGRSLPRCS